MCDKVVSSDSSDNTQEMCDKAVDDFLPALKFVPDQVVTRKLNKKVSYYFIGRL